VREGPEERLRIRFAPECPLCVSAGTRWLRNPIADGNLGNHRPVLDPSVLVAIASATVV